VSVPATGLAFVQLRSRTFQAVVSWQRAVADKATVPIYYESRISKLSLNAAELPKLDAEFEEITKARS
jgi:hypothetical protein